MILVFIYLLKSWIYNPIWFTLYLYIYLHPIVKLIQLRQQNYLNITSSSVLQVCSKYSLKHWKNSGVIKLTVDTILKNKINTMKKFNVGWSCIVQVYFSVIRYFKCTRYGHVVSRYLNNPTCLKYASAHKIEHCTQNWTLYRNK